MKSLVKLLAPLALVLATATLAVPAQAAVIEIQNNSTTVAPAHHTAHHRMARRMVRRPVMHRAHRSRMRHSSMMRSRMAHHRTAMRRTHPVIVTHP